MVKGRSVTLSLESGHGRRAWHGASAAVHREAQLLEVPGVSLSSHKSYSL